MKTMACLTEMGLPNLNSEPLNTVHSILLEHNVTFVHFRENNEQQRKCVNAAQKVRFLSPFA